ncbi:MAG: glycosyltransferase family 4 protein [Patescibacteria group bacterium]|nr:glycosyltransferase family 4 protein [Patescibacteria group bacterium]
MKILWLTWKDLKNPLAGGAEVVNQELAKRLAQDGHEVIFIVGGFDGCAKEEIIDGYKIIRLGGRWTVYWQAYKYYKKNSKDWPDLVIDEINTIPFLAKFYVSPRVIPASCPPNRREAGIQKKNSKVILFIHQLCRQIWFYQIWFPLNLIGYLLEPIYLWLLNDREVITVSQSTQNDLLKYGFKKDDIKIISEGIEILPLPEGEIERGWENVKFDQPSILSLGSLRAMKRTLHIVKAFEIAKKEKPDLQLIIAGDSQDKYGQKVLKYIQQSKFKESIKCLGRVSKEKKIELMQKSHLICVTSVKEGWGLIVTEANSQGTPAVVYNVDGLRDSVKNQQTGLVCQQNTPQNLAENIIKLLENKTEYDRLRKNGWQWSREINFEKSYRDFKKALNSR